MAIEEDAAALLTQIVETGLQPLDAPEKPWAVIAAKVDGLLRSVRLSETGQTILGQLVDLVRADPEVAHQVRLPSARQEVRFAVLQATVAWENNSFDSLSLAEALLARLHSGQQQWTVILPILGLTMAGSTPISVAGMRIGHATMPEIAHELAAFKQRARVRNEEADVEQATTSSNYWGVGTTRARMDSAMLIIDEQLALAFDILRCFASTIGINPDETLLGDQDVPSWQHRLAYNDEGGMMDDQGPSDPRRPYEINEKGLTALQDNPFFAQATTIAVTENRSEMEDKIIWGIRLFGQASRVRAPEAKIHGYTSVLETVLAKEGTGEGHDRKNRPKKIRRRVALFYSHIGGEPISDVVERVYALRDKSLHHGYSSGFRGQEFARLKDVQMAQALAHGAILIALHEGAAHTTREAFVDDLDRRCGIGADVNVQPPPATRQ